MRTIRLCAGRGMAGKSHCVMSATSIVAEEPFSDHPKCVCPTITKALITINDKCPTNEIRERLLGHLPWLIIGTKGNIHHEVKRAQLFAKYAMRRTVKGNTAAYADAIAYATDAIVYAKIFTFASDAACHATNAAVATAIATATNTSANIAWGEAWEQEIKKFIDFIEEEIIPVYTTMPIEPNYNIERLILNG